MRGIVQMEDNKSTKPNILSQYGMENLDIPGKYILKPDKVNRILHFLLHKILLSISRR